MPLFAADVPALLEPLVPATVPPAPLVLDSLPAAPPLPAPFAGDIIFAGSSLEQLASADAPASASAAQ
jgi:hypothetical protein